MNKPFLLTVGDHYYPESGAGDWVGCFSSYEEAMAQIKLDNYGAYTRSGKLIGEGREKEFDWYEIIDLRKWVN
jgi:hypothetical protein